MPIADIERAFVTLCCSTTAPEPDGALDAEHAKIWGIYRNMVRNRFLEEAKLGLKRTLKAVGEDAFVTMFSRFMAESPPRSRAFFAIVPEIAAFAAPLWQDDANVPAWSSDLVRYEAARYAVSDMAADRSRAVVDFDFDRVPVLHDAQVLITLGHRVQREPNADGGYDKGHTELCIYRGKDERTISAYGLSPFNADCMRAWQGGATVSQSVHTVSAARGIAPDAKLIDALCTVLSDFIERGIVLGSRRD